MFRSSAFSETDSLKSDNNFSISQYILPLTLITAGSAVSGSDLEKDLQSDVRNAVGNDFEFKIDDYTLFVPIAELYLFDWAGFKAENNFFDRTKNLFFANLASQVTVSVLKNAIDKTRPNGDNRRSFPSGHTNIAFTNATVLYHEYKNSNKYIAYSGYLFAVSTGALRIMNNNHWTGDVLAGAGIGILCSNLVYRFEPFKDWHPFGFGSDKTITVIPDFGDDSYGVRAVINL